MRKKLLQALLMAIFGTIAAAAIATGVSTSSLSPLPQAAPDNNTSATPARVRPDRADRGAAPAKTNKAPQRIFGGTNGDKPLYGMGLTSFDGPFSNGSYPAQVSASGNHTLLSNTKITPAPFSGCWFGSGYFAILHSIGSTSVTYATFDPNTWGVRGAGEFVNNPSDILASGLTYDPATRKIYGMFYHSLATYKVDNDAQLGVVDLTNAMDPVTIVGDMDVRMRVMAADKDGVLYGIAYNGDVYTINKYNASVTKVGKITLPKYEGDPSSPWHWGSDSAVFDWETGLLYMSYTDSEEDSFIVRIDPANWSVAVIGNYGYWSGGTESVDVFTGLFFKQEAEAAAGGAPAAVTGFTAVAVGAENKVKVEFTMPTADTDGNALTDNLTWRVNNGSSDLATGTAAPGAAVSETIDVPEAPARVNVVLYVANGTQEGSPVNKQLYVGADTPVIDGTPTLSVSGKRATLRWTAPYGLNGGNLATPLTYTITRMPDATVVADAATGTSYVDIIQSDIKKEYHYIVRPKAGEIIGNDVISRARYVGTYFELPHATDFSDETLFNEYPVIDNNDDNNTWYIDTKKNAAIYPSNGNDPDDYLLIGPFMMEKGSGYTFTMTANGHSLSEKVAVYAGTGSQSAAAYTTEIIGETWLEPAKGAKTLSNTFRPDADGSYYFAIKACSSSNTQNIYIYNVKVEEVSGNAPDAVTDITAVPGASSATFTFKMPTATLNGAALTQISGVKIYRDDDLMATVTDQVTPGATLTYVDNADVTRGFHTYKFVAVNNSGDGQPATTRLFRGLDIPGTPHNIHAYEDLNTQGLVHISWEAPQRGENGGYINPDDLTYYLDYSLFSSGTGEATMGKTLTYDMQCTGLTKQTVLSLSVYAGNSAGAEKRTWGTSTCYVGPQLPLPLHESWIGCTQASGVWTGNRIVEKQALFESYWEITSGEASGKSAQDADGGMMTCTTSVPDGGYRIISPRVDLGSALRPTLVFYYYYTPQTKDYEVEVIVDDQPIRTWKRIDVTDEGAGKWHRAEYALDEFKGSKRIQFAFKARAKEPALEFALLDNVTISDFVEHDLAISNFTAPVSCDINTTLTLTMNVRNNGSQAVKGSDWRLILYKNGERKGYAQGVQLASDTEIPVMLTDGPTVTDKSLSEYYVEIEYAADLNAANNRTPIRSVRLITPAYPRVTDLEAESTNGVNLTWSDPSASDMTYSPVMESFENYESYTIDGLGEWRLHDGDQCTTVIMATQLGVLDYPHIGEPMAWQVLDPDAAGIIGNAWFARTGKKLLASFQACVDGQRNVASDDWLISPELFGHAQTISFYAHAGMGSSYSPETMDIMYSTTGNNIADFKPLASDVEVAYASYDWPEFVFDLPEGTRHFAIVHKSTSRFALLLDDITYIPAGSTPEKIELQGFNVYRDNKRLNSEPVVENEYFDATVVNGRSYTYHVTAIWDKGESGLSNAATITASTAIETVASPTGIIFEAVAGGIRVKGARGYVAEVFTPTGTRVAAQSCADLTDIALKPGIYVVRAGGAAAKIAVR